MLGQRWSALLFAMLAIVTAPIVGRSEPTVPVLGSIELTLQQGPSWETYTVEGDTLRVSFVRAEGGLALREGGSIFIAGEDGKFVVAEVRVDDDSILLRSNQVIKPTAIRYRPTGPGLRNGLGWPSLPFQIAKIAPGSTWYVATTGDDRSPGTRDRPFASIQRAQQSAMPGDLVFVRGGTYRLTEANIARVRGIFASIIVLDKSGAPRRPITYRAFGDERPIFDCSQVKPAGKRVSAFLVSGSWLRLKGLEVTGTQVTIKEHTQSICFESQGSYNRFERLSMYDGKAIGIYHVRGQNNLFLNCDAWNNWDNVSEDGKGGNVDGFGCHPTRGSTGNVFRGCRAWFNSDDGFDCINAHESVTFEQCWAMYNGLSPKKDRLADGNGFKAGGYGNTPANRLPGTIPRHVVQYCVAVGNKNSGFYANHHPGGGDWLHNSAFRNGINFNMRCRLLDNHTEADGFGHVLINNLGLGARRELSDIDFSKCELRGNSFPVGPQPSEQDFVNMKEEELIRPRQPDGRLPRIDFLRPKDKRFASMGAVDRNR